jgi:recombination protein RecT
MTETVSSAVAKRNEAEAIIERYTVDFAQVLPSHIKPDTFVRLSQGLLRRDPKLGAVAKKNPGSFLAALLDCARLGHEPGTEQYYLVPFGNEIVGIEGYRGIIERIYRAGAVSSIVCEVVRQGEAFRYRRGRDLTPVHDTDWDADDEGALKLVYAYALMRDGSVSRVVVMKKSEVMKHKAESKAKNGDLWTKWEKSAWLKTAARELEKWVPSSAEYRREQLRAAAEADALRNGTTAGRPPMPQPLADEEIADAEIVEDPPANPLHYDQDEIADSGAV